jgi:hypothetical protein
MYRKLIFRSFIFTVIILFSHSIAVPKSSTETSSQKRFQLEIEGGAVWQQKNDIEIPNDGTATRFSVPDLIGTEPSSYYRIYMSLQITSRQDIRILYAPLTIDGSGTPPQSIRFENQTFSEGVPLDAEYTFNSYRITYRYMVAKREKIQFHVGFTAKIRDAKVVLSNDIVSANNSNVGFVPLLHVAFRWNISPRFSASLDADALAAPQGRAEDVALKFSYDLTSALSLNVGYRGLEGGADNEDVYTFAWLHYALVSLGLRF